MKTKSVIFSFLMICATFSFAQPSHMFKVLAVKGTSQVQKDGSWSNIAVGNKLYKGSKVKLPSGSYVSLVHITGKSCELKSAGTYDVTSLSSKYAVKSTGFVNKYTNFVLAEVNGDGGGSNYGTTGAVTRAALEEEDLSVNLKLYSTNIKGVDGNHMLKSDPGIIKWDVISEDAKSDQYVVEIRNMEDKVILTKDVSTNELKLDFSSLSLQEQGYFLTVVGKDNTNAKSKRAFLRILTDDQEKAAEKDLADIKNELDLSAAVDNLVLARYYEEKKMFLNAVSCYEKALEIAPGVESYENAYNNYLYRIGVKTPEADADNE